MYKKNNFVLQEETSGENMKREERIEKILTALACRSTGIPEDMLPIPQNYEEILDFGEDPVSDYKSKLEILKFERNWSDLVEEEELRQRNALTVIFEKERIRPQTKILQEMLQELKREVSNKAETALKKEKLKRRWAEIHQEMMGVISDKMKMDQQLKLEKRRQRSMDLELKIVWSLMTVKREIQQLRVELTRDMLMGLKKEVSNRVEKALTKEELKVKWTSIHQEMMGVVSDKIMIQQEMDLVKKKKRSLHLELLTVIRMMNIRKEIEELRESMRNKAEDARTEKHNERELEVMKSNEKDNTCNQDNLETPESGEIETFIPRELFLFNIETFKMDSKHVDEGAQECSGTCSNSESEMIECTPTADERSNVPKKKTLKSKIQKFFRLRS
ncbi:golgin subfamily A member 6-like protein 22 [Saccostrea cucullata]|uniref:golgin subfamily A member 6-like protein 22 n=1 Tax=Saccostrea cuccullata TaxID=36930 RepID=UPI002ED48110